MLSRSFSNLLQAFQMCCLGMAANGLTGESDPQIEAAAWARAMARRVEAQFARDWVLGYAMWNYHFGSLVNSSQRVYIRYTGEAGEQLAYTNQELADGTSLSTSNRVSTVVLASSNRCYCA